MPTRGACPNCGEFVSLRGSGVCPECEAKEIEEDERMISMPLSDDDKE